MQDTSQWDPYLAMGYKDGYVYGVDYAKKQQQKGKSFATLTLFKYSDYGIAAPGFGSLFPDTEAEYLKKWSQGWTAGFIDGHADTYAISNDSYTVPGQFKIPIPGAGSQIPGILVKDPNDQASSPESPPTSSDFEDASIDPVPSAAEQSSSSGFTWVLVASGLVLGGYLLFGGKKPILG